MAETKETLSVWAIGADVLVGEKIRGLVTSIIIVGRYTVKYEVAWWDGRKRNCEWFQGNEVEGTTSNKMSIGFKHK